MSAAIFEHLSIFPSWLQSTLVIAWGLTLTVVALGITAQTLQSPSLLAFLRTVREVTKRLGSFLKEQANDPIRYPRIERILQYGIIGQFYVFSLMLFVQFTWLVVCWGLAAQNLVAWQHVAILGFSFLCLYMAAVFKAQAGKERIKLRKH